MRILVVADANFLAHVSRSTEVARRLRDDFGHEVVFAGDGPFLRLASEAGFPIEDVFTVSREDTMLLVARASVADPFWWRRVVERSVASDLELIDRVRPDVVIGDMHWSLAASCTFAGVPYVSITNASWTAYSSAPLHALDRHFSTRLLGRRLAERSMPRMKEWLGYFWAFPYRSLFRRRGLSTERVRTLWQITQGDLTLLADLEAFEPTHPLPSSIRYVGPLLWEPRLPVPSWIPARDRKRPSVYFTMGSSGDPEVFREAVTAFGTGEFDLMMTTGGLEIDLPKNAAVHVAAFAPGLEILRRTDLAVIHGGSGTIYQALTAGVPMIGIPSHVDQERNLQRVADTGVGIHLRRRAVSATSFRDAAERIFGDDSFRSRAGDLAEALQASDGAGTAAREVHESFGAGGGTGQLRASS